MSINMITLRHGVAYFTTGAVTKSVALSPGEGNFSISEVQGGNSEAIPVQNRGVHYSLVKGAEVPVEFSITIMHDGALTSAGTSKPWDAIFGTGNYSGETTDDPGGVVWTGLVTLVSTTTTPAASVHTHTFVNARLKGSYSEAIGGNTITLSGTAYGNGTGDAYSFTST